MGIAKLTISRGYQLPASDREPDGPHLALVPQSDPPADAEPVPQPDASTDAEPVPQSDPPADAEPVSQSDAPDDAEPVPQPDAPADAEPVLPLPPVSPDYLLVHDRLTSLERLARLFEQGALSAQEFADEKALILGRRADEQSLRGAAATGFDPASPHRSQSGPSLVGRMLSWKFLLVSLFVGLGFSFVTQPDATLQLFDQVARYLRA